VKPVPIGVKKLSAEIDVDASPGGRRKTRATSNAEPGGKCSGTVEIWKSQKIGIIGKIDC
jgi:hypothetical protein